MADFLLDERDSALDRIDNLVRVFDLLDHLGARLHLLWVLPRGIFRVLTVTLIIDQLDD